MSDELTKSVDALATSGTRFRKRGTVIAIASLAAIGAGQAAVHFLAPGLEIRGVHIPAEVLSQFANYDDNGPPFTSAIQSLGGILPIMAKLVAVMGVVAGGVKAMSSGDVTKAVGPVVAGLVLLGAVSMSSAFFPTDEGSGETARDRFSATADRADVAALRAALEKTKVPTPAKDYVLAQAALVSARAKGQSLDSAGQAEVARQVRDIDTALQKGMGIDVDPRTLYLLERRVLGGPKSAVATQYGADAARRETWGTNIGAGTAAAGLAGLLVGGGMLGLAAVILRRVKRLRGLLTPSKAVSA